MSRLLEKLTGGDRRSIGRSEEVVAEVLADLSLFPELFEGLLVSDPLVRMRAADALEKITAVHPALLQPFKAPLLAEVARLQQQEVRWHFAQMVTRLDLDSPERLALVQVLTAFLKDKSRIVQVSAMQALADLALQEPALLSRVLPLLQERVEHGSPAARSRGKKLLKQLAMWR